MTSFLHSAILISAVFLWIICIGIVIILIGCAILFACNVTQKIHKKTEDKKKIEVDINENKKSKRTIIGPFNSPKELIDYVVKNPTDPNQIAVVNIGGVAKAFHAYKTIDNVITIEEAIVDWDEITYQLSIENARYPKELKG